ncbi:MAG: hypothetical protein KGI70_03025 [Patescibacteria group bacterium]|nr:hypothetical protein [Patescibacteria group bacterium]
MPIIALAILIAAALGGGVSAAAAHSTPGDVLWGFKVEVNESLQGALSFGDEQKANWDIAVAQERLQEAQRLAAEGKLDANAQAQLAANFRRHASDVADRVAALEATGKYAAAADVSARFESTLSQSASVLAQANVDAQGELSTLVRSTLGAVGNLSADASAQAQAHAQ